MLYLKRRQTFDRICGWQHAVTTRGSSKVKNHGKETGILVKLTEKGRGNGDWYRKKRTVTIGLSFECERKKN